MGLGEDPCTCEQDCGVPPNTEMNCSDAIDNDCDDQVDCDDADCQSNPACISDDCSNGLCEPGKGENQCTCPQDCGSPPSTETNCSDGVDNDCDGQTDGADSADCSGGGVDADNDGWDFGVDCDDNDPTVNPGQAEVCDGKDNNCDGIIDNNAGSPWYRDADGDGYGHGSIVINACDQPQGYVFRPGDCDETNPNVKPSAQELCGDGIDNNCDGIIDPQDCDPPVGTAVNTWFGDKDGDGFGDVNHTIQDVLQPSGFVRNSDDCNDFDNTVYPGAGEICGDGIDNDCNNQAEEGCLPPHPPCVFCCSGLVQSFTLITFGLVGFRYQRRWAS